MEKAGPLAPVLHGLLQIDPDRRLDGVRAALMLARVAAGGAAEEPLGGPAQRSLRVSASAMPSISRTVPRRPQHRGQHRAGPVRLPSEPVEEAKPQTGAAQQPARPWPRWTPEVPSWKSAEGVHRKSADGPAQYEGSPLVRQLSSFIRFLLPRRFWPPNFRK